MSVPKFAKGILSYSQIVHSDTASFNVFIDTFSHDEQRQLKDFRSKYKKSKLLSRSCLSSLIDMNYFAGEYPSKV